MRRFIIGFCHKQKGGRDQQSLAPCAIFARNLFPRTSPVDIPQYHSSANSSCPVSPMRPSVSPTDTFWALVTSCVQLTAPFAVAAQPLPADAGRHGANDGPSGPAWTDAHFVPVIIQLSASTIAPDHKPFLLIRKNKLQLRPSPTRPMIWPVFTCWPLVTVTVDRLL